MEEIVFDRYEDRDAYLREDLSVPIPRRHDGPAIFFSDFQAALRIFDRPDYSLITPNPIDYLPFDRVRLILDGAFRLAGTARQTELDEVVEKFSLGSLLQRQVYTLSGGETLRVAMAKCALEAPTFDRLVFAAPWGVLSDEGHPYVGALLDVYRSAPRSHVLLSLSGDQIDVADPSLTSDDSVQFGIRLESLRIPLTDSVDADAAYADVKDFMREEIASPCLIRGENGHGKSLLSKALAGAIRHHGNAELTGRPSQRVRLIFQDVSNQALLAAASLDWLIQRDPFAEHLTSRIMSDVDRHGEPLDHMNRRKSYRSLLKTKIDMIALRLARKPAALILDEPDWGLARHEAVALVRAVAAMCAQEEVALLLITHRRWFDTLFRSRLTVRRASATEKRPRDCAMQMQIEVENCNV